MNAIFRLPSSGGTWKYAKAPSTKTWRDSLPIDMLLSAVSVLAVAQSSSEILEGLMNNPVLWGSELTELQEQLRILLKTVRTSGDYLWTQCWILSNACGIYRTDNGECKYVATIV